MLKKLMRMEERIVLDGAVATAVVDTAANAAGSDADAHDPLNQENNAVAADEQNNSDGDELSDDSPVTAGDGMGADTNPDSIEADHVVAAMEAALDNINNNNSQPLKALVVNTDLSGSSDLIAAAADDVIVITYDGDTADMETVLNQLDSIAGDREYESIALATHSSSGGEIVLTDSEHVTAQSLNSDGEQIAFFNGLGKMLTEDGRIDLMSCYTGMGEDGDDLIDAIENISGAEVAASTDATGNETAGGDWILEKGDISVSALYFNEAALTEYSYTMQSPSQQLTESGITDFGTHIAQDGDILISCSNDYTKGFVMYTYEDNDSDGTKDTWVYSKTFKISAGGFADTDDSIVGIYDLEIKGDSFAVSVDGGRDVVFIYDNISSAADQSTESAYFAADSTYDIIGTDIELIKDLSINKNVLFWTEQRDTDSNYSIDHSRVAACIFTATPSMTYIDYDTNASIDMKIAADHVNNVNSLAITSSNAEIIKVWDDISNTSTFSTLTCDLNSDSNNDVTSNIDMKNGTIIASIPTYESSKGAIAVFSKGSNNAWDDGEVDLTAKLTNHSTAVEKNIGLHDITISETGERVFSTVENNRIYAWDISEAIKTPAAIEELINPLLFTSSGAISSIASSESNGQIYAGVPTLKTTDVFNVPYTVSGATDPTIIGYTDLTQVLAGGTINNYNVASYSDKFGTHVAEDNNVMVVATDNIFDGIKLYTYTGDTNSDGTPDTWDYQKTFYIDPDTITSFELSGPTGIFDLDIEGNTFIVSMDGWSKDILLVYEDILNSSRSGGVHESEILSDSICSSNIFGEDIDIVEGAIYATTRTETTGYSKILYFWDNSGQYGTDDSGESNPIYRVQDGYYAYSESSNIELTIAADKRSSGTNAYTLAATGDGDSKLTVWAIEDGGMTTAGVDLTFIPEKHGGNSSSAAIITNLAVEEGIILASTPNYSTSSSTNLGAVVAFRGVDGVWTNDEFTSDGKASINTVFVGNPDSGYTGQIGLNSIGFSENRDYIAATTSGDSGNAVLLWHHDDELLPAKYTYIVAPNVTLTGLNPNEGIVDIDVTNNGQVLAGSPTTNKLIPSVTNTGVVNVLNGTQASETPDVNVTETYTPGITGQNSYDPSAADFGSVSFSMSETVKVSEYGTNMTIKIGHMNESNEFETDATISSSEAASILSAGSNKKFTIDLNESKYNGLESGKTYKILVPSGMFGDTAGGLDSEGMAFAFTISENPPTPTENTDDNFSSNPTHNVNPHGAPFYMNPTNPTGAVPPLGDLLNMLKGGLGDGLANLLGLNDRGNSGMMGAADALGMGFGNGVGLGLGNAANIELGMVDAIAMGDLLRQLADNGDAGGGTGNPPAGPEGADPNILSGLEIAEPIKPGAVTDTSPTGAEAAPVAEGSDLATGAPEGESGGADETAKGESGKADKTAEGESGGADETAEAGETAEADETGGNEETAEGEEVAEGEKAAGEDGDAAEGDNQGEKTAAAESKGDNEQGAQDSNNGQRVSQAFNPAGPVQNMMIQNPFAENVSTQQTQALFSSSLQAFSSLAIGNGSASFGMAQDAMGDTMTTAALVNSSEQILNSARDFLAMLDTDEVDTYNLSGGGYTAATESISIIIEDAIASMVEARGNALVANDLLRILSINIKGFDDRIAENSFSSGVNRLASCNQELAYSYEVLNAILKVVQTARDDGTPLTTSELNELLPQIEEHATEISLSVSEKGDRASKDVLTFLTKRMQQKGIDKDNLQAQVNDIFEEWHSNLGLSAPVTADQPIGIDLAQAM